jgi:hypothetical protein
MTNKTDSVEEIIDVEEKLDELIDTPPLSIEKEQDTIIATLTSNNLINDDIKSILLDPKSSTFISIVKDNVNFCVNELKEIDIAMQKIYNQKNSELFFKKSENIKLISQYISKVAAVNQKTIDLLILLLGSGNKISEEYETIMSTIEELGSLHNGEAEVLNYLLKIKKMVFEIRDNDLKLKLLNEDNEATKLALVKAQERINQEIKESEKARKIIESKFIRLERKIKFNNLYIGFCMLLIIALAIFIGVKFYVF